jgi:hypothetical protein
MGTWWHVHVGLWCYVHTGLSIRLVPDARGDVGTGRHVDLGFRDDWISIRWPRPPAVEQVWERKDKALRASEMQTGGVVMGVWGVGLSDTEFRALCSPVIRDQVPVALCAHRPTASETASLMLRRSRAQRTRSSSASSGGR